MYGWRCDFLAIPGPTSPPSLHLGDTDAIHFDYFRLICAPEFALFFQIESWSSIVLQAASSDPSFRRIALAVGALSRSRYTLSSQQQAADRYALCQYNMAIRELGLLEHSPRNIFRIVLASITLIVLEFLLENYNRVRIHLRSALSMLSAIKLRFEEETALYFQALTYIEDMLSCQHWTTSTIPGVADVPNEDQELL